MCGMLRGFYWRSMMNDWDSVALAFDVLESAEVMQEFDDFLWIKVDREQWERFHALMEIVS
jgi:hypothetical protein